MKKSCINCIYFLFHENINIVEEYNGFQYIFNKWQCGFTGNWGPSSLNCEYYINQELDEFDIRFEELTGISKKVPRHEYITITFDSKGNELPMSHWNDLLIDNDAIYMARIEDALMKCRKERELLRCKIES